MAITSTSNRISYTGNGVQTAFTFPYVYYDQGQLLVYLNGVLQTLSLNYTVSPTSSNPEDGNPIGGTITFVVAPANASTVLIVRSLVIQQTVVLNDGANFPAKTIEKTYDQIVMMLQQHDETLSRAVRAPIGDALDMTLPAVATRASSYLGFNASGFPVALPANSVSGTTVLATGSTTSRFLSDRFSDWFNALDYGVSNAGAETGAAITAFLAMIQANGGGIAYFPRGTYSYATSPNFALTGVSVYCDEGALFNHTGAGNAFILNGIPSGEVFRNRYARIVVQGNVNSTNGFFLANLAHCEFVFLRCKGCATTGAGFYGQDLVLNNWYMPRCTVNEGVLSPKPLWGMILTSVSLNTTTQNIFNPVFEGLNAVNGGGIKLDKCTEALILNGTSEGNYYGTYLTANASANNIKMLDMESNTSDDVYCAGPFNVFECGLSTTTIRFIGSTARGNELHNVSANAITLDNTGGAPYENAICGGSFGNGAGVFTDNGTRTHVVRLANSNAAAPTLSKAAITCADAGVDMAYSGGGSVTPSLSAGQNYIITASSNVAFTVSAPLYGNGTTGLKYTRVLFTIRNTSGVALGALTWAAEFKLGGAWTQPANGFSRSIEFMYNGTNYVEINRTAADVAN